MYYKRAPEYVKFLEENAVYYKTWDFKENVKNPTKLIDHEILTYEDVEKFDSGFEITGDSFKLIDNTIKAQTISGIYRRFSVDYLNDQSWTESGNYYCVIVRYSDGSTLMSTVKQKK